MGQASRVNNPSERGGRGCQAAGSDCGGEGTADPHRALTHLPVRPRAHVRACARLHVGPVSLLPETKQAATQARARYLLVEAPVRANPIYGSTPPSFAVRCKSLSVYTTKRARSGSFRGCCRPPSSISLLLRRKEKKRWKSKTRSCGSLLIVSRLWSLASFMREVGCTSNHSGLRVVLRQCYAKRRI